jgi:preprotein translocase subunit SecG
MNTPKVKAEIEEAHKQQMEMMKLIKAASASDRKSRKRQSGGFLMKTANNVKEMTTFLTTLVMVYRGKSAEAIDGFVEKYASDGLKKRIEVAGKDAAKFLEVAQAKTAGGSVNQAKNNEDDIYTGDKNEKGEKHGIGKMEYENGDVYEGHWVDDLRHGKGKITFVNKSSYDGNWSNGQINGRGVYTYFNGNVYNGLFENGLPMGYGKMTYLNGDVYEGDWKKGQRYGAGKMFYKNGEYFVGHWKKDKREGEGKLVDASGNVVIEGEYEDDKAPFDVSNIKTKLSKVDSIIGKAGETIDKTINSPNVKMFREKLKQVTDTLPAVPDAKTFGKYSIAISFIFSYVMYLFMSKNQCTPMEAINPAKEFFFCAATQNAYNLLQKSLGVLAGESSENFNLFLTSLTGVANVLKYVIIAGASGFFILMFYFAWTYINTPHEDHEKVIQKARASSRRNSSSSKSSSSPRRTEKRK